MVPFLIAGAGLCLSVGKKFADYLSFAKQRDRIKCRVHVNGIRGKSTVTRYVSAIFREAGYKTFGKTTGSAARILLSTGEDFDFKRKGYPNVNEQVGILSKFAQEGAEVAIMECMATNPIYAEWLEHKVMHSHIGIITNVRLDHQDQMGETLEEIAASLSKMMPKNGTCIVAEYNPTLLGVLLREAKARGTRLILADKSQVTTDELKGFSHFAIEDNVAIGLEIAKLLKLPRDRAVRAMQAAQEDIGAFRIKHYEWDRKEVAWANLFAVNDRESFEELCRKLFRIYDDYTKIVILNNRYDRPIRVEMFAKLAASLNFQTAITFGDFEDDVARLLKNESPRVKQLGNSTRYRDANAETLLSEITNSVRDRKILLVGTVNIHTPQAEHILELFEHLPELTQDQREARSDVAQGPSGLALAA